MKYGKFYLDNKDSTGVYSITNTATGVHKPV